MQNPLLQIKDGLSALFEAILQYHVANNSSSNEGSNNKLKHLVIHIYREMSQVDSP